MFAIDHEVYWNTVIGANRNAADVVKEFAIELTEEAISAWLATAEEKTIAAGSWFDDAGEAIDPAMVRSALMWLRPMVANFIWNEA